MTHGLGRIGGWAAGLAALALVVTAGGLVLLRIARAQAIEEMSALAAARPGEVGRDRVAALVALAGSEDEPLDRRDRAIWVLGEIRDPRALPALERLHVQEACDHERLVCQREVRKAMAKIRGELSFRASLRAAWRSARDGLARLTGRDDHPPRALVERPFR